MTNAHVVQACVGHILGNASGEAPAKLRAGEDVAVLRSIMPTLGALQEALRPDFKVYARNIVANAKALAET